MNLEPEAGARHKERKEHKHENAFLFVIFALFRGKAAI